jgi:hypothetical protein
MKITKTQLKQIIKEELGRVLSEQGISEGALDFIRDPMMFLGRAAVPGGMTGNDEVLYQMARDEATSVRKGTLDDKTGDYSARGIFGHRVSTGGITKGSGKKEGLPALKRLSQEQLMALMLAKRWEGPNKDDAINRILDMMGIELAHALESAVDSLLDQGFEEKDFSDNVRRAYGAFASAVKKG